MRSSFWACKTWGLIFCLGNHQVNLKRLLWSPPVVERSSADETLQNQPFIGALPETVQEQLLKVAKENLKFQGSTIYRKDTKVDGIWLIANGVVKVSTQIFLNRITWHHPWNVHKMPDD